MWFTKLVGKCFLVLLVLLLSLYVLCDEAALVVPSRSSLTRSDRSCCDFVEFVKSMMYKVSSSYSAVDSIHTLDTPLVFNIALAIQFLPHSWILAFRPVLQALLPGETCRSVVDRTKSVTNILVTHA